MKKLSLFKPWQRLVFGLGLCLAATQALSAVGEQHLYSPDKKSRLSFNINNGSPSYSVTKNGSTIIARSTLGVMIRDRANLSYNLKVTKIERSNYDQIWEQPWGQNRFVREHYNRLLVQLEQTIWPYLQMDIEFKIFNDGVGFRYFWPQQKNLQAFEIWDENTEFVMRSNDRAWWIPAFQDNRYEYLYTQSSLAEIKDVHTPLTIKTQTGFTVAIHEAALIDFASMALKQLGDGRLKADLVPWHDGIRVKTQTPKYSPWRTIQIAERDADLLQSNLILNLNAPNKLGDVSQWVYPGKYIGIWWGMHLGKFTWEQGPKHGATTAHTREYIDFAAANGFQGVLVEGWNYGWNGNWYENGELFNFTQAYDDYDLPWLSNYAKAKGVKLIGHHETGAATKNYERQLDDAFAYLKRYNIDSVKTGYVGKRLDHAQWHHGQYAVRHHQKVVTTAAKNQVMIFVHEPIKPTGLRRTYPNLMAAEGARGQEFNAWASDGGNPPKHTTILPFTRLLAGPMDFTPGIFDLTMDQWRPNNRVKTTLAKQLALYVTIFSPWQMAADLPENYRHHPAFQFIKDVPTNWEKSLAIHGEIGEMVTYARKERGKDDWYIGSITNERPRQLTVSLDFLDPNSTYLATIYADGENSSWDKFPYPVKIERRRVRKNDALQLHLAAGGGAAIQLKKLP